jgi:PAS domain S-box-containing protein
MEDSDRLHVLIVEDDADICDNLQDILELDDHHVRLAHTGSDALGSGDLESVNVILLDWRLPDMTALQLLPMLNSQIPEADIIIVTGHGDLESAVASLRQGAVDYLLKPINPDSLRTTLQRIGRRQRLERDKSRSERAFRQLIEGAPCAIVIVNSDGNIVYFSAFAEHLTGFAAEDVLGQDFYQTLVPLDARDGFIESINLTWKNEQQRGFQSPLCNRNDDERQMVWNTQFLEDYEGIPAVMVIGHDITEYQNAMERLVQSERLAAIGEAMTGLIHESRNALARSQANLRRLARRLAGQEELIGLIEATQRAQEDIQRQFEEVRAYAAPLKLNRCPVALEEVVGEAWQQLESEREGRSARLRITPDAPRLVCEVDRFQMVNAIRNLLENSLTACDSEVMIDIDFSRARLENREAVKLSIRDHGPGLSCDVGEKALEPFYTTKTRGTGLGLAIVKRVVEAHGGEITIDRVNPAEGTGTVVSITLSVETCNNSRS